ncbi:uncharacterized protein EMH_0013340 [Eimeria mitis]|uniref:Uncharacterized protein n=1 Tax=Eimeria mitis TaxID=44415 RepID=U6KB40_9EIME|nr:uncharacterized protein EMH_0013340 [Eimeria mitis]CDJ32703.1 hypothetical protein EMH_0013340 [Eimeria mitis]
MLQEKSDQKQYADAHGATWFTSQLLGPYPIVGDLKMVSRKAAVLLPETDAHSNILDPYKVDYIMGKRGECPVSPIPRQAVRFPKRYLHLRTGCSATALLFFLPGGDVKHGRVIRFVQSLKHSQQGPL